LSNATKDSGDGKLPVAKLTSETSVPSSGGRPYRRRLSNYLLDKRLQLRYVGVITILSTVLCGTLGYLIWQQENQASSEILDSVDSLCEDENSDLCLGLRDELNANLSQADNNLVLIMSGVGVGLVGILFLFMVVMTHKVAGPLYKVTTYFEKMARGRLGPVYPLRKGDMLQEFFDDFQSMHEDVRGRFQQDNELVERFLRACADAGVSDSAQVGEAVEALKAHHESRTSALG